MESGVWTIENETLRLGVRALGAELCTVKDLRDGYEYLWQGGEIWSGQSPLLFPIVGRLREDTYFLEGERYTLPKHGFARRSVFAVEEHSEQSITLLLKDSEATRAQYPFAFELRARYEFTEGGFVMQYRVKNPAATLMYFSIGAHPGFQCAMGDRVILDEAETASAFRLNENGLRGAETLPVFDQSQELVVTPTVFQQDALIFDGLRSKGATLHRQNGRHLHVDFGGAPCLGLWAKPGAEYVCIEPWYGIDDRWNADQDFTAKERICRLEGGEEFVFSLTVTLG